MNMNLKKAFLTKTKHFIGLVDTDTNIVYLINTKGIAPRVTETVLFDSAIHYIGTRTEPNSSEITAVKIYTYNKEVTKTVTRPADVILKPTPPCTIDTKCSKEDVLKHLKDNYSFSEFKEILKYISEYYDKIKDL